MDETQTFSDTMRNYVNSIHQIKHRADALTDTFDIEKVSEIFESLFSQ